MVSKTSLRVGFLCSSTGRRWRRSPTSSIPPFLGERSSPPVGLHFVANSDESSACICEEFTRRRATDVRLRRGQESGALRTLPLGRRVHFPPTPLSDGPEAPGHCGPFSCSAQWMSAAHLRGRRTPVVASGWQARGVRDGGMRDGCQVEAHARSRAGHCCRHRTLDPGTATAGERSGYQAGQGPASLGVGRGEEAHPRPARRRLLEPASGQRHHDGAEEGLVQVLRQGQVEAGQAHGQGRRLRQPRPHPDCGPPHLRRQLAGRRRLLAPSS